MSAAALLAPVIPVLVGVVFLELAVGALGPVAGVQLVERNASPGLVGLVASAHYAGFLAGALTAHRAIDRVGHVRAFSALAVVAATATLLHGLIDPPIAWAIFRFSIGWALAGLFVVAESWLNDKATAVTRGRTFATYMVVSWAASGVGPLVLTSETRSITGTFTAIGIGFALAVLPMALTTVGNPEIEQRAQFGIVRLFRISPLGVVVCFGAGLVRQRFLRNGSGLCGGDRPRCQAPVYSAQHRHHRRVGGAVSDRLACRPPRAAPADAGLRARRRRVGGRHRLGRGTLLRKPAGSRVPVRQCNRASLCARRGTDQRLHHCARIRAPRAAACSSPGAWEPAPGPASRHW